MFCLQVSNHNKILTSFIAGGFAGAVAKTTIAPLDRTKINFQSKKYILCHTYQSLRLAIFWGPNMGTIPLIKYNVVCFLPDFRKMFPSENLYQSEKPWKDHSYLFVNICRIGAIKTSCRNIVMSDTEVTIWVDLNFPFLP